MTVYLAWFGGPSYAGTSADDREELPSIAAAVQVMRDRDHNVDGRTPCVEESEGLLWFHDPRGVDDPYPDRLIRQGPRGGWRVEPC